MAIDLVRMAGSGSTQGGSADGSRGQRTASLFGKPVSSRDLIYFTSQLSLMLEIGTSLTDAARALELQTANPQLRAIIAELRVDMEEGQSFSSALAQHMDVFDGVFVSMVRAGETGGYLRDALERIVEMREKREALITQLRAALTYPLLLAVMAFFVVVFILTNVLPKFAPMFEGKEEILPGSTRMLMALSSSMRIHWWVWGASAATLVIGAIAFLRSPAGRWLRDKLAVSLPVVGDLNNKILTGQLLRTLGNLLESQVVLTDALAVTRSTLGNRFYRELMDRVTETVEGGGRLSQAFLRFGHMPPAVRQMIATGEEAGNIYPVMLRLASHYDTEVEHQLKRIAALIEPLALVIVGSVVGLIVASVILPLFKMAHAIG